MKMYANSHSKTVAQYLNVNLHVPSSVKFKFQNK